MIILSLEHFEGIAPNAMVCQEVVFPLLPLCGLSQYLVFASVADN